MSSDRLLNDDRIRFGEHCSRAFNAYFDQIGDWMPVMLMAAAIYIAAAICCVVPLFFVAGPLACGLHLCGIDAIRGYKPETACLQRGWDVARRAVLGSWLLALLQMLPTLIVMGCFWLGILLLAPQGGFRQMPPPFVDEGRANVDRAPQQDVEVPRDAHRMQRDLAAEDQRRGNQPQMGPNDRQFLVFFFGLYALMLGLMGILTVWFYWIATRTMFVMPLLAERNVGVRQAFAMSWNATRTRFWELLFLNLIGSFVSVLGMYICYIGVVLSLPLYFTFIASAYDERFPEMIAEERDDPYLI